MVEVAMVPIRRKVVEGRVPVLPAAGPVLLPQIRVRARFHGVVAVPSGRG